MYEILAVISITTFFIAYWKKPILPLKTILIALLIYLAGLIYFTNLPNSSKFLKLNNDFTLIEEKKSEDKDPSPWEYYVQIYGTYKKPQEVKTYLTDRFENKAPLIKLLLLVPGAETFYYRSVRVIEPRTDNNISLEIHSSLYSSMDINISSPPFYRRGLTYPTEVQIRYQFEKKQHALNLYLIMLPLFLFMGFIWYWVGLQTKKEFELLHKGKSEK